MRLRIPSPAMGVAIVALVMATTGTAVAGVNFVSNAGAVDGKSAVSAASSLARAKGRLVATARGGRNGGRIPGKFLADVSRAEAFARALDVTDNAAGAAIQLAGRGDTEGIVTLTTSCGDQNPAVGAENPVTIVTLTNVSGTTVNAARRVGVTAVRVFAFPTGTVDQFTISGSQTFEIHLERRGVHAVIDGAVRQDGLNTATGSCLAFGTVELMR